jgi:hypothetical protein
MSVAQDGHPDETTLLRLRAWRSLPGFEGRGSVRSWLYAIAANASLDIIRHRSRRELPVDFSPAAQAGADLDPPLTDRPWLEPCREFLTRYPLTELWKHDPAWANGQLAVGCYLFDHERGCYVPAVIDVLTLDGQKIAAVTGFQTAQTLQPPDSEAWITGAELFSRFRLPAELS